MVYQVAIDRVVEEELVSAGPILLTYHFQCASLSLMRLTALPLLSYFRKWGRNEKALRQKDKASSKTREA